MSKRKQELLEISTLIEKHFQKSSQKLKIFHKVDHKVKDILKMKDKRRKLPGKS